MLNEAITAHTLNAIGEDVSEEALTREEILKEIEHIKLDPKLLESHLAGVPNIHPMGERAGRRADLHPGTDSYIKKPETKTPPELAEVIVLAK